MGYAGSVRQSCWHDTRQERKRIMKQGYYTVVLDKKGFPIYFLCPSCNKVHSFPENPEDANFNDPGEASSFFEASFSVLANWNYLLPFVMFQYINSMETLS
jgi:hypothetical protein